MSARTPVAVLISGRGSNMAALIDAARTPDFPAKIAIVLSDRADAPGLQRAAAAGVPQQAVDRTRFADKTGFEAELTAQIEAAGATHVCLAGFMRIFSPPFIARWQGRILNIHPSLLPAFQGLDTHGRALRAGAKLHGATVHVVTDTLDDGPILAQAAIRVGPDDTEASLEARVLRLEHALYPAALCRYLRGEPATATNADADADVALFSPHLPPQLAPRD